MLRESVAKRYGVPLGNVTLRGTVMDEIASANIGKPVGRFLEIVGGPDDRCWF